MKEEFQNKMNDIFKKKLLKELHPAVSILYFAMLLVMTMFSLNPVIISISFIVAFASVLRHRGFRIIKQLLLLFIPIGFFSMIILPLFNHNGVTPLFYINDMAVTLENIMYGLFMSLMLMAVSMWFITAGCMIDSEKILYIFGRVSPKLSLVISMVLRFVPMITVRWREIHEAQIGMLCIGQKTIIQKARQFTKELSILISWCLENSIDTSVSMESRGYGIGKRTSYHRFKMKMVDKIFLPVFLFVSGVVIYVLCTGGFATYYFPEFYMSRLEIREISAIFLMLLYMFVGIV